MVTLQFIRECIPVLGISICTLLASCNAQGDTDDAVSDENRHRPGQQVEELPDVIWPIYQSLDSTYWFGSNGEGVFHYDGKSILQYTISHGLASDQLRGIQEDSSGNIYFDTSKGVTKYDGQSFKTLKPVISNEWKSEAGDLWFNLNGDQNAVFRYDGSTLFQLRLPEYEIFSDMLSSNNSSFSPYGVYSITKDSEGKLWFGTSTSGVYVYHPESQLWITDKELLELEDGRVPAVRSIVEDKDGHFWLSNSLHRYLIRRDVNGELSYEKIAGIDQGATRMSMDFPYYVSAVVDSKNHDLWMCTYSEGIWRYDGGNLFHYPVTEYGIEVNSLAIYEDRKGDLWVGTHGSGVFKFNGSSFVPHILARQ